MTGFQIPMNDQKNLGCFPQRKVSDPAFLFRQERRHLFPLFRAVNSGESVPIAGTNICFQTVLIHIILNLDR